MRRYHLVEFAAQHQKGFRNHIVPLQEIPHLIQSYKNYECHASCFFFPPEILTYMEMHLNKGRPSIGGYDGKVWATFLAFDLDSQDLEKALDQARIFANMLFSHCGLNAEDCLIYFSGAKGFHFMLDTRVLGHITPSKNLHITFSQFRKEILLQMPEIEQNIFDLTIKDKVRLLRLPNTKNQKTQKYKVQLLPEELFQFSTKDILEKATYPHELHFTDDSGLVSRIKHIDENPTLSRIFYRSKRVVRQITKKPFRYPIKAKLGKDPEVFLCPGMLQILHSSIEKGFRNNCAIRLVSEFRRNGLNQEDSEKLMHSWNHKQRVGLSDKELNNIITSAYFHSYPYHYSCSDAIIQSFCPLKNIEDCQKRSKVKN